MKELWDLYNRDRLPLHKTAERGRKLESGSYHMVVHVCLFNPKGEMLIQHRQTFKAGWPNLWDVSVGGSALAGETSQIAAERETLEELGIKIDLSNVRPHLTINFDEGFDDFYLIELNETPNLDQLLLQYEEVQAVKWASYDEILEMMDQESFIPYYKHLIGFLFENRKAYGAIRE